MKKLKYIKLFENFRENTDDFNTTIDNLFGDFEFDVLHNFKGGGVDDDEVTIMFDCSDKETLVDITSKVEEFVEIVVPQKYKNFTFYKQIRDNESEDGLNYSDDRCDLTLALSNGELDMFDSGISSGTHEVLLFSTN